MVWRKAREPSKLELRKTRFLVSDFTTPDPSRQYTFPPWLRKELEAVVGQPVFDIVYRS